MAAVRQQKTRQQCEPSRYWPLHFLVVIQRNNRLDQLSCLDPAVMEEQLNSLCIHLKQKLCVHTVTAWLQCIFGLLECNYRLF